MLEQSAFDPYVHEKYKEKGWYMPVHLLDDWGCSLCGVDKSIYYRKKRVITWVKTEKIVTCGICQASFRIRRRRNE